ncbi:MAG: mandelate racemase/muconate lactonizing enzyme family protein, partial [Ardenticatenaceae bacterium]
MKITNIETFIVDAGWRPWTFVKVETDEGITGWGDCSDGRSPQGVAGTIADLKTILLGKDPRQFETRFWDMIRGTRQSPGGIAAKAIAGLDCAFLDIKAKALGISCVELFGGPTREKVRLYWSHCGSSRVRHSKLLGTPPIETWGDITALGKEVVDRGFTALKTNVVMPGKGRTWSSGDDSLMGPNDENVPNWLLRHIER